MGYSTTKGQRRRGRFGDTTAALPNAIGDVAALYAYYYGDTTTQAQWTGVVGYAAEVDAGTLTMNDVELIFALYWATTNPAEVQNIPTPLSIGMRICQLCTRLTGGANAELGWQQAESGYWANSDWHNSTPLQYLNWAVANRGKFGPEIPYGATPTPPIPAGAGGAALVPDAFVASLISSSTPDAAGGTLTTTELVVGTVAVVAATMLLHSMKRR